MRSLISKWLAAYLSKKISTYTVNTSAFEDLEAALQPGDVLLVDGDTRISVAIKYLTQSTWSHATLYLGHGAGLPINADGEPHLLIEADLEEGIRSLPLSYYRDAHTRICRPLGLNTDELEQLKSYAIGRLGHQYDLQNVIDLARYLCPTPPVPTRYRRRMLAFGSSDPTRAICSTFIAEGFQLIRYPILPIIQNVPDDDPRCGKCKNELFHIRHHSLFVPRDFDASPFFKIVKPSLTNEFDFHQLCWDSD